MRRFAAATIALLAWSTWLMPALAQDARQRQAAAEAYDRGTAAYLDAEYAEAAQWFETANRMAPAAPALMQAIRSHQRAESFTRAATLALRLSEEYGSEPAAAEYANSVLADLSPQFVRVDAECDADCKLDLDGKLQEFQSFFLEPGNTHTLIANFKTGSKSENVQGEAGETLRVEFAAPPPPPEVSALPPEEIVAEGDASTKPLPPLVTFIGAGVTGALIIGTVLSGVDTLSGVDAYESAAAQARECMTNCGTINEKAKKLLDDGQGRETRTNILLAATAVSAVATGVIAIFFTDWTGSSDDEAADDEATLRIVPTRDGALGLLEGRF